MVYDNHFRPANDVVFAVMFGDKNLFKWLSSAALGERVEFDGEVYSQAVRRENEAELNKIVFDTFIETPNLILSMDMQRKSGLARLDRRTVYYSCRAISTQPVDKMQYEDLKPVCVVFMLSENDRANQTVKLCDVDTHEIFDDLLTIKIISVPKVLKEYKSDSDLYIFARFFAIDSQETADLFEEDYKNYELGKELIIMYATATKDTETLREFEKVPYFTGRLSEADKEEIARKAAAKSAWNTRIEAAKKLIKSGLPFDLISDSLDLDRETVAKLAR